MTALGKALAAGTLAFGAAALFSGTAGASSPYSNDWNNNSYGKDDHAKYTSYDRKSMQDSDHSFYRMSRDDQQRLCEDDSYWNSWNWYYSDDDRGTYCNDFWSHDGKDHGKWGNGGNRSEDSYNKDESYNASYSKMDYSHEKQAYAIEASSSDSNDYGRDNSYGNNDQGWNNNDMSNDSSYGSNNDNSSYKAEGYSEKTDQASVQADVTQKAVVNNYTYVDGDNNNVNNNVSVANTASVDQKASSSEVNYANVAYNTDSSNDYDSDNNSSGWGDSDHSSDYGNNSSDTSYKAMAYSEKDSSSEVKQDTSYSLNESDSQSNDSDRDHGSNDKSYDRKDGDKSWNKDSGSSDCNYQDDGCDD